MNGDRIRFIDHRGKRILLVDCTDCTPHQIAAISILLPSFVSTEPRGSLLILGDFTGAQVDRYALEALKKGIVFDRPYLKRSAWVVKNNIPKAFMDAMRSFSVRDLPTFHTREQALSYLVGEDEEETQKLASPA
ncbi:MAG TPA: hypothetical protein VJ756_11630 [Terriglobales bacterium]|jgi:hypothetical protein|nr:hypothetical protein [Terriglobales bacterium]